MEVIEGIQIGRLLSEIRVQYCLPWDGIHGIGHWQRVMKIGLALAERTGADRKVVTAFALLHDARRLTNDSDPEHGQRAGVLACILNPGFLELNEQQLDLLCHACDHHSTGMTTREPTIGTCWDADRLDLSRFGIRVDEGLLSTEASRDAAMISWAWKLNASDRGE